MNLLEDPWIPVRAQGSTGSFRLLRYAELLCSEGEWQVSLPRDDLELACIQLLVCMTQVMFIPEDDRALRSYHARLLASDAFVKASARFRDWFDLDHPTQPFMQTRGVRADGVTPIQKLMVGLPEGNNHAFFNDVGEVRHLSAAVAAIALFNQTSNAPSFGGGFKGSLRGGAPITTLVRGDDLRQTIWRNVLTLDRVRERLPQWSKDSTEDRPTWVDPIKNGELIPSHSIGLARGLFWQPAHVELVAASAARCDVLDQVEQCYSGFRKERFTFVVAGPWPHPHGALIASEKKGSVEWKFVSFTTEAPAWTLLTEFLVPRSIDAPGAKEGVRPAAPVVQWNEVFDDGRQRLDLLVGGYCAKKASIEERRHELFSIGAAWARDRGRIRMLVDIGRDARKALVGNLDYAVQGHKDKGMKRMKGVSAMKGIGAPIHKTGEKLFYWRTESLFHETLGEDLSVQNWKAARIGFTRRVADACRSIYEEMTDSYASKAELIPIIAAGRSRLNADLAKLTENVE